MAIQESVTPLHWNYFLSLEEDLVRLSRYVEFSKANEKCYSIEIARILMAACSEIDVVAKQICKKLSDETKATKINQYREEIKPVHTNIASFEVIVRKHGITLTPWDNWEKDETPDWWSSHNNVKHERNNHFDEGNLINALNSVAALYVLVLYLHADEAMQGLLSPSPVLFGVGAKHFAGTIFNDYEFGIQYYL